MIQYLQNHTKPVVSVKIIVSFNKCHISELEKEIQIALSHITEGLCRPLKVRVEQVLMSSEQGAVILFKLGSVLKFYLHTIE